MLLNYKDSGVNIDEGNALVSALKPIAQSTFTPEVIGGIGSFAGAYALPSGYKEPVILAATDGVGTKLRLAIDAQDFSNIGIDLVAMCVNDLICNFATPLFFLDYFATGKLNKSQALKIIESIAKGCRLAHCALIGGESAEMPDMYANGDFDIAGFAVGIAEKNDIQSRSVQNGDVLIALPSSGIHSNGYSLVRKAIKHLKLNLNAPFGDEKLIDALLKPTHIYVNVFKRIMSSPFSSSLHALAHITGGGIMENLARVIPHNLQANIDKKSIQTPAIFDIFHQVITEEEAFRTFNMGVGLILVVAKENATDIAQIAQGYVIGEVAQGSGVQMR